MATSAVGTQSGHQALAGYGRKISRGSGAREWRPTNKRPPPTKSTSHANQRLKRAFWRSLRFWGPLIERGRRQSRLRNDREQRLENDRFRSHTCSMANLAPIKVLFVCNTCGQIYLALQQRAKGAGQFDCTECLNPVYAWSGSYDYVVWMPLKSMGGVETLQ